MSKTKRGLARLLLPAALTAVIIAVFIAVSARPSEAAETSHTLSGKTWTERTLTGKNRYVTAVEVAKAYTSARGAAPTEVILVYGRGFPDALSAGALAGVKKCPIILSERDYLPGATQKLLTDTWGKSVTKVTMVGGGFNSKVVTSLKNCGVATVDTKSFAGSNRVKTAELVAKAVQSAGATECAVATGYTAADSLSMSSWSYALGIPIILTNKNHELTADSLALAKSFRHVYILGGTSAVSASTEVKIGDISERLSGPNRYATSQIIARHFLKWYEQRPDDFNGAALAPGADANYPDALVGGPLAGEAHAPVILVKTTGMTDKEASIIRTNIADGKLKRIDLLGAAGTGKTRTSVIKQLS